MIISVIIPVYNAEKYLKRCIKSVFEAIKNIDGEILLIDNNSSDNSYELSKEIASSYNYPIRLFKCSTPGAGAVRNMGAKKASGEYLWFIDADDEVTRDSASLLIAEAEKTKADLVMMGARRINANGKSDYLSAVDASTDNYRSRFVRYGAGPWQFLIRRKWWLKNDFMFKDVIIHEDMEIISSLILYTNKYASVDRPLYFYYQNEDSVLHKQKWDPHYLDIFGALEGLHERFKKAGATEEFHDELEWFFIWNLLIDSAKDFAKFPEGRIGFSRSRKILKKYYPKWRKNRFLKEKPLKLRARVYLNYLKK